MDDERAAWILSSMERYQLNGSMCHEEIEEGCQGCGRITEVQKYIVRLSSSFTLRIRQALWS